MKSLKYISTDTPAGDFHIIMDTSDVALASGFGSLEPLVTRLSPMPNGFTLSVVRGHEYERLIKLYFAGEKDALKAIQYHQVGSDFQDSVWNAIAKIPYGDVVTYKELAVNAGHSGAVRAIGSTCGSNRLVLLVPCHRVVRSDGGIGEYVYGTRIKQVLLEGEGYPV